MKTGELIKKIFTYLLFALVAAQVIFPLYTIVTHEMARGKGTAYKFRVRPIDPYDPFRGRYVTLGFVDDTAGITGGKIKGNNAFVTLMVTGDGYAMPAAVTENIPASGDYIAVKTGIVYGRKDRVRIIYPFNKLFMNEDIAPAVDKAFRDFKGTAYLKVFVRDGSAAIDGLYFDGVRAEEYVKNKQ